MRMYRSGPMFGATYVFDVKRFTRYYSLLVTFLFIVTDSGFNKSVCKGVEICVHCLGFKGTQFYAFISSSYHLELFSTTINLEKIVGK